MSKQTGIFGVRLNPIAFMTLFEIPAFEITNQKIDISTILGVLGEEITDKVATANSFLEQMSIIVTLVEKKLKTLKQKYLPIENALQKMQITKKQLSIHELVTQSYLSPRQFERHFKELTGFSAKTYLKITRFEQLVETITMTNNFSEHKLLDIALDFGYYDQAHLNHHFKEFTGVSPTAYFKGLPAQIY
jgi:AraC-like DNA-binding protein